MDEGNYGCCMLVVVPLAMVISFLFHVAPSGSTLQLCTGIGCLVALATLMALGTGVNQT